MENQDKDWETEFSDSFTKKIPFPMMSYEYGMINPADSKIMFTMAKASVHDDTNFHLYTDADTATNLAEIVEDLKKQRENAPRPQTPKKEEKEEEKTPEGEGEDLVDEVPEAPKMIAESGDLTEKAIIILEERRALERLDRQKEKDSKKKEKVHKQEDKTKKKEVKGDKNEDEKKEDDKESDEGDSDQEKKKEIAETGKESINFSKIETEETFGDNLKQCQNIFTKWEIRSTGYRKIKEIFIFDTVNSAIEFSTDGKFFLISHTDC